MTEDLHSLETCISVNNNLRGKLDSLLESPMLFDIRVKLTSVPIILADFNLWSCESDNFIYKVLCDSFYFDITLKQNRFIILSQFPVNNLE